MALYAGGGPGTAGHLVMVVGTFLLFVRTGAMGMDWPRTTIWLDRRLGINF